MATVDPEFDDRFSELTNALQVAALLARERVVEVRTESAAADQLYAAVSRAVEAARQLRRTSDGGRS